MGKKVVLINVDFDDIYDKNVRHTAGDEETMTDERIAEIKAVNPALVSVVGAVEDEDAENVEELKAELEKAKAEAEQAKAEADKAKAEADKAKKALEKEKAKSKSEQ